MIFDLLGLPTVLMLLTLFAGVYVIAQLRPRKGY